ERAEPDEAVRPAEGIDEALRERRKEEHAGRARRGADAEGHGALLRRDVAGEGGEQDAEGAGADAEADEHAAAYMQPERRGTERHQEEAKRIDEARDEQHAPGAELVGDRAEEGLAQSPEEVLQRHGEAEGGAVPAGFLQHRKLEEAHGRAWAEG